MLSTKTIEFHLSQIFTSSTSPSAGMSPGNCSQTATLEARRAGTLISESSRVVSWAETRPARNTM